MTSVSKHVHIDELEDMVHSYNNTHHSTIKMRPTNLKINTGIDSRK